MRGLNFRDFKAEDLEEFTPMELFGDDVKDLTLGSLGDNTVAYSVFNSEGVIGVLGATKLWTGVAQIWSVFSEEIKRYPKSLTVIAAAVLNYAFVEWELVRAEAHVRVGHARGIRWIEFLGFKREGLMKNYLGLDKHAYLYARYV